MKFRKGTFLQSLSPFNFVVSEKQMSAFDNSFGNAHMTMMIDANNKYPIWFFRLGKHRNIYKHTNKIKLTKHQKKIENTCIHKMKTFFSKQPFNMQNIKQK